MNTLFKYASLVKFSHTIFAMPFALIGYTYALTYTDSPFRWLTLVEMLFCMVLARNAAMGFNRWADRRIDALNPRTTGREIPAGVISERKALWFVIVNAVAFMAVAGAINTLCFMLSPVALFIILGYSYTKRFTSFAHIVLGVALSIAPIGAYIAVAGTVNSVVPILLGALVVSWVAGFDILYSLQDIAFDKANNLHSIPSRLGKNGAVVVSILLHLISVYNVVVIGLIIESGTLYWVGTALFTALVIFQHTFFTPAKIERVGAMFGLINGATSIVYACFAIADMVTRS